MRCLSRIPVPKSGGVFASRSHLLLRCLTCEVKADFLLPCLIIIIFLFCLVVQTGEHKHKDCVVVGKEENLTLLLLSPYIIWNKQLLRCLRVGVHP